MSDSAGGRVKSTSFPPVSRRGRSKSDCPAGLVQRIRQWRVCSGGGLRFPLLYAQPYERAGEGPFRNSEAFTCEVRDKEPKRALLVVELSAPLVVRAQSID